MQADSLLSCMPPKRGCCGRRCAQGGWAGSWVGAPPRPATLPCRVPRRAGVWVRWRKCSVCTRALRCAALRGLGLHGSAALGGGGGLSLLALLLLTLALLPALAFQKLLHRPGHIMAVFERDARGLRDAWPKPSAWLHVCRAGPG